MKTLTTLAALAVTATFAHAATVPLASTMNPSSHISEDAATGGFGRINEGDGSLGSVGANTGDADAIYSISQIGMPPGGATLFGTPIDLFPREADFVVGNLTYDESAISGSGVETTAITAIDLSEFWSPDPARTDFTTYSAPTVVSDLSDYGIGLWFFNGGGGITFGALDASDTVTFTDGLLTSINLQLSTTFTVDTFGSVLNFDGTISISGDQFSYQINDTESTFVGPSTLVTDLTGTVNAVVPEPASVILTSGSALMGTLGLRRRR